MARNVRADSRTSLAYSRRTASAGAIQKRDIRKGSVTTYGLTWKMIREETGMVVHSGIASDQKGLAEQIKNAIETSPFDLLGDFHGSGLRLSILRHGA